jgi:hypothetical protein
MSKISLAPDASGSGIFTIASPNSNTNRTLTLPDDTGTIVTNSGNQAGSFTTLNTSGAVVFNDAGADVDFRVEGDTDANLLFVDAGNNRVGIGTSTPTYKLDVEASADNGSFVAEIVNTNSASDGRGILNLVGNSSGAVSTLVFAGGRYFGTDNDTLAVINNAAAGGISFCVGGIVNSTRNEGARITSGGYFKASNDGTYLNSTGSYHEFRQTASDAGVLCTNTNASYASDGFFMRVSRAATSAYNFAVYQSVNGGNDTEFKLRGDGNGYADGTWNNNGADYAEFFESANGEALTLGATVVLDGNKVREATDQDPASAIFGVVRPKEPSKASMVIGNTAWNKWANKYLTDDFDRYIMEDHDVVEWTDEEGKEHSYESQAIPAGIIVPADATRKTHDEKGNKFQHYKLNPAWDKDAEYVNRENRPEWNIIGLLGQVKILKGQPVGDRWIKMRDVSETVEEWMIR